VSTLQQQKEIKMPEDHEVFAFLDNLRESGKTNMFLSPLYLSKKFKGMSHDEAVKAFIKWVKQKGNK